MVKVQVETPRNLNAHQKKLLREFEATLGKKTAKGGKKLVDKIKEGFRF